MPALVGVVQIITIAESGIFNIGDVYKIQPISQSKTFAGSGSFVTGDNVKIENQYSSTNTYDQDGVDMPIAFTL
ncbi:MAG: spore germination protein [Bacillales bacterium]|nr:spore germination protein [Bacillales bacterium]